MRRPMILLALGGLITAAACNPRARWLFKGEPAAYGAPDGALEWVYMGDRTYQGDLQDGAPHGLGTLTWPDGRVYRGAFVEGQMEGPGVIVEDGVGYGGTFLDGELQPGPGARIGSDGRTVVGIYEADEYPEGPLRGDQLRGPGTVVVDGRVVYSGPLDSGEPGGTGWGLLPDGTEYLGRWDGGQPDGDEGICTRDGVAERCHYVDGEDRTVEREAAIEAQRHAAALAEIEAAREERLAPAREAVREAEREWEQASDRVALYGEEHSLQLSLAPQSECDYAEAIEWAGRNTLPDTSCVYTLNPKLEQRCYCEFSLCLFEARDVDDPVPTEEEKERLEKAEVERARSCWDLLRLMARGEDPRAELAELEQEVQELASDLARIRTAQEREEAAARRAADAAIARAESARAAEAEKARRSAEEAMRERLERWEEGCAAGVKDCGCRAAGVIESCKNVGPSDFPSRGAWTEAGCGCVNPI